MIGPLRRGSRGGPKILVSHYANLGPLPPNSTNATTRVSDAACALSLYRFIPKKVAAKLIRCWARIVSHDYEAHG
jgi:hypothetical protein